MVIARRVAALVALALLSSCSGTAPTLRAAVPGLGSQLCRVGDIVTFGSGVLTAHGAAITITAEPTFSAVGVGLAEPIRFENPAENGGQEPGSSSLVASKQFTKLRGPGVVIRPGDRWFVVMSVTPTAEGRHVIRSLTVPYRAGDQRAYMTVRMAMTLIVRK